MSLRTRLFRVLDRLQPSEATVLLSTAIAVGAGTALGAVAFIRLIEAVQIALFEVGAEHFRSLGRWVLVLAPLIGGLLAGPIIAHFAKGHVGDWPAARANLSTANRRAAARR